MALAAQPPLGSPYGRAGTAQAVTERVPGRNHRIFSYLPLRTPSQSRYRSTAPPEWEPRAAAPPGSHGLTLWPNLQCKDFSATGGRRSRPLALPMGELARLKAVTERVPGRNHGTYTKICSCVRPLRLADRSPAPPEWEPRGGRCPPGCFPNGGNNVGAMRRQCHRNYRRKNLSRWWADRIRHY